MNQPASVLPEPKKSVAIHIVWFFIWKGQTSTQTHRWVFGILLDLLEFELQTQCYLIMLNRESVERYRLCVIISVYILVTDMCSSRGEAFPASQTDMRIEPSLVMNRRHELEGTNGGKWWMRWSTRAEVHRQTAGRANDNACEEVTA